MSRVPLAIVGVSVLAASAAAIAAEDPQGSYLERAWKLGVTDKRISIDDLQPYRPIYIVLGKHTDNVNTQPSSPAPDHTVPVPIPWSAQEMMFQLSFKSELVSRQDFGRKILGLENVRLWFAYTQRSFWQVYNSGLSRPFRDTDYEPEVIFTFSTGNGADGWKLLNLGVVHQSNGRALPQSRGWNRLYAQGGWEWHRFTLLARLWYRIPESVEDDDNPDIRQYLGSGDLVTRYQTDRGYVSSVLVRRKYVQLDWATPLLAALGAARLHLQLSAGYGESLIDYNHNQVTLGLGVSFGDW